MGTGADRYIESWSAVVAAFNQGDIEPLMDLLAADCTMDFADTRAVAKSEIRERVKAARAAGWYEYHPVTMTAHGPFMVNVARNMSRDGSIFLVAAVFRFDEDGKLAECRQISTRPVPG